MDEEIIFNTKSEQEWKSDDNGPEPKKLTRKQKLIENVSKLYPDMDVNELKGLTMAKLDQLSSNFKIRSDTQKLFPNVSVSKMPESESECKKLMGKTINERLSDIAQDKPVNMSSAKEEDVKENLSISPELEFEMRTSRKAKTLYNFHLVGGGILETLSEAEPVESRLGSNLAGLTKDLIDEKEEFLEVLKDIYTDYHEEIDPYINSLTVYGLFMSNKIQNRFMENKKKSLNGKLPKSSLKLENLLGLQSKEQQPPYCYSSSSLESDLHYSSNIEKNNEKVDNIIL